MYTIDIGKTLFESFDIIISHPIIMVPALIIALLSTLVFSLPPILPTPIMIGNIGTILIAAFVYVITAVICGMYPVMTRDVLDGKRVTLKEASNEVKPHILSLLGAGILVGLIVVFGLVLLIIPGIIFLVWFWYTIPAVMLGRKSATGALSASKEFVKGKAWRTFLLLLVIGIITLSIMGIFIGIVMQIVTSGSSLFQQIPYIGYIIYFVLTIPILAWTNIVPAYVYLKYAELSDG